MQLHPDKNSNSRAETAFKLVSEVSLSLSLIQPLSLLSLILAYAWQAYFCLSDSSRRRAFDTERKSISCIRCNPNSCKKTDSPTTTHAKVQKPCHETSRHSRLQARMRELRDKLTEEATIIEKCLIANAASRKEPVNAHGTRRESPVFNPSDYQHQSYPHHQTANHKRVEDLRAALKMGNRGMHSAAKRDDYPIFQYRSERVSSMSRCGSVRNRVE